MLKRSNGMGGFSLAEGATHTEMFGKARKSAFTLAEVLITLGIIGVVAAMTMPTLINSTQGAQYKTAYKKALSVMSQAVVMNIALEDYDLSQVVAGTNDAAAVEGDDDDTPATTVGGAQSLYDLFKNRMNVVKVASTSDFQGDTQGETDYYKIINVDSADKTDYTAFATLHGGQGGNAFPVLTTGGKWPQNLTMLFFNDGITFIFDNTQANCAAATATTNDHYCFGFIDVNGQKAPNRVVACDGASASKTIDGSGTDNANCVVTNPTDIYPVALYDQSVVPASAAARAVLYAK
ncbi:hypothetical protein DBY21_03630 [Candidatus Gastranaerophilales bacterium]|nr:MAG: hypothetical protein DBY21_03630 [Candidatus Gastranaerophilales bacterium]